MASKLRGLFKKDKDKGAGPAAGKLNGNSTASGRPPSYHSFDPHPKQAAANAPYSALHGIPEYGGHPQQNPNLNPGIHQNPAFGHSPVPGPAGGSPTYQHQQQQQYQFPNQSHHSIPTPTSPAGSNHTPSQSQTRFSNHGGAGPGVNAQARGHPNAGNPYNGAPNPNVNANANAYGYPNGNPNVNPNANANANAYQNAQTNGARPNGANPGPGVNGGAGVGVGTGPTRPAAAASPGSSHTTSTPVGTSADEVRRATKLLRKLFELRMVAWTMQGAHASDEHLRIEKERRADQIMIDLQAMVDGWKRAGPAAGTAATGTGTGPNARPGGWSEDEYQEVAWIASTLADPSWKFGEGVAGYGGVDANEQYQQQQQQGWTSV